MTDKPDELNNDERTLALAATMVETMRERYGLSDEEMDVVTSLATQVLLLGELPDEDPRGREARRIILEAMHRLSGLVADIHDARDRKTVN